MPNSKLLCIYFAVGVLLFPAAFGLKYNNKAFSDDAENQDRIQPRGMDATGERNLMRNIYREKPRDFLRTNRGLDSLSGASFGLAKRLDSLAGLGFGNQKRNMMDEIDRSNFGNFAKRNFDEIDRSDFDRFVKKWKDEIEEKLSMD